jgi:hypothetical protein
MINLSATSPPGETDPLSLTLATLIERLADPAGNADRAARLEATIAKASNLIERITTAINDIDLERLTKVVGLGRELIAVQGNLQMLRGETQARAEQSKELQIEFKKRLNDIRGIAC